jgi:hypothetical protein
MPLGPEFMIEKITMDAGDFMYALDSLGYISAGIHPEKPDEALREVTDVASKVYGGLRAALGEELFLKLREQFPLKS